MEECSHKQDDHAELEKLLHTYIPKLMHEISRKDDRIAELESELISKKKVHPITSPITSDPDESPSQNKVLETSQEDEQLPEVKSNFMTLKEEAHPITPDPYETAKVIPVQRTIPNFAKTKEKNGDYKSEPFYSHPDGYKMCLWVFPNGYGTSRDTFCIHNRCGETIHMHGE